ncbi:MAG: C25 family cysteine peptidase [bacterium]|nr:C25 family cysteine peptidase [bacterium]
MIRPSIWWRAFAIFGLGAFLYINSVAAPLDGLQRNDASTSPKVIHTASDANLSSSRNDKATDSSVIASARILAQTNQSLRFVFEYPEPSLSTIAEGVQVDIAGIFSAPTDAGYTLPIDVKSFVWLKEDVRLRIVEIETKRQSTEPLARFPSILGDSIVADAPTENLPGFQPIQFAEVRLTGKYRGIPLAAVVIHPVRYDASRGELMAIKRIVIEISGNGSLVTLGGRAVTAGERDDLAKMLGVFSATIPANLRTGMTATPRVAAVDNGSAVRIDVREFGYYRFSGQQLANLGVPIHSIDPARLRLEAEGVTVPIHIVGDEDGRFDEEDQIEFFGRTPFPEDTVNAQDISGNRYSEYRSYLLGWNGYNGVRMPEISGEIRVTNLNSFIPVTSANVKYHFEENNYLASLSEVDDDLRDRWLWDAGIYNYEIKNYPFRISYPDTQAYSPIKLRVCLTGLSGHGSKNHAFALLNGTSDNGLEFGRGDSLSTWESQEYSISETSSISTILNNNLHHNLDTLSIFSPGDAPSNNTSNRIALNWFQIEYLRLPIADRNEIRIGTPRVSSLRPDTITYDYLISNFTSPDIHVFRTNQAKLINGTVERYIDQNQQIRYRIHFQDRPGLATEYFAITSDRIKTVPDSMMAFVAADSLSTPPNGGAEYLVIGTNELLGSSELEQVLQFRRQQYNGVMKIDVEQVYRRFSNGMFHRDAIRNFLSYAVENWSNPPRTVMLLGDAQYNQQQVPRRQGALIPHPLKPIHEIGLIGSDTWYQLLDNDFIPDIAVSRVPARNRDEVASYFNKVLEFENSTHQERWMNSVLFIRGQGGPGVFEQSELKSMNILGPMFDFSRLQVTSTSSPFYGNTSVLQELFGYGNSLVIYNGHGGGGIWADNGLFRTQYIKDMTNQGRYGLICNFSCFIVSFNGSQQRATMGEEFIFSNSRGSIGIFGSAGLGYRDQGLVFQEQMFKQLALHPGITYGQLMTNTKVDYINYIGGIPYFGPYGNTFWATSLLGDPGIRFPSFQDVLGTSTPDIVQSGDSITVSATLPISSGTARIRWYKYDNNPIEFSSWNPVETVIPVTSSNFQARLLVPTGYTSGRTGTVRIFIETAQGPAVRVAAQFYLLSEVGRTLTDSLITVPFPVVADSSFHVYAKVLDSNGLASLRLKVERYDSTVIDSIPNQPFQRDTLDMAPDPSRGLHWYSSPEISGLPKKFWFIVQTIAIDSLNNRDTSANKLFLATDPAPDLLWVSQPELIVRDTLFVKMTCFNNGQYPSVPSSARLIILSLNRDTLETNVQSIPSIRNRDRYSLYFPVRSKPGTYWFTFRLDPDSTLPEINEANNYYERTMVSNYWWINGATGTNGDTYEPSTRYRFSVPPGGLEQTSTVLQFTAIDTFSAGTQSELKFPNRGRTLTSGRGFLLRLSDTTVQLRRILLDVTVDSVIGNRIKVHGRSETGLWRMLSSTVDTSGVHHYDGAPFYQFALIDNQDRTPPRFNLTAEGQIFSDDGYVRRGAKFNALVYDNGGVDLSVAGTVVGLVDGDTLDPSELIVPTGLPSSNTMPVTIYRRFDTGRHWAKLEVTDLAGNRSNDSIVFRVANDFKLEWIGNFPNPFHKTTTFFFSLTDQTNEPVHIHIYTVSGRKIRTVRETDPKVINYREITWDGRDENGQIVANGVYFYRFVAKNGEKTIEHKGKLAKLR